MFKIIRFKQFDIYLIIMVKALILKVRANIRTGQKTITIPKECEIKMGDYVEVRLVEFPEN